MGLGKKKLEKDLGNYKEVLGLKMDRVIKDFCFAMNEFYSGLPGMWGYFGR